ncbi:MAG: DNA topoisomerase (ATP-hydrolyzing) subunit A [Clostridia bacterium]|nr:DNA topoisomerase (ATP-hydrolyzing) subunit A [Clostridia bacterium]
MPRKKKSSSAGNMPKTHGVINNAGEVVNQDINDTLRSNYMPYAMSVIMSRAIPEIDGLKPSHRKLLYTMYKMNLLGSQRTKSANIVGQTMRLNPHGDQAIYDTMARMSRGYEALLHPYVDSKGNFGKFYSRDMACAASRYTEAKLDPICKELFKDIDKDTVDFVDNYDNTMKEPSLLPVSFPNILVNSNTGIAVGMASSICSFNLKEICDTTIEIMKDSDFDIMQTLQAPDFPGGGEIVYDKHQMRQVLSTGRGSIRVRSVWNYDKSANCVDVTEIPPTTSSEAIVEKVIDLVKTGKVKEISDIRDETGIDGLKITIDLKRGVDADKFMQKLMKMTPLEDNFSANFNVLIAGVPKVMGVKEILQEWIAFRTECVRRRTYFDLQKKSDKLHLLEGLELILLDIDKAVKIVRETEEESDVVPNLMIGFGIDEVQAEYVAEIKLRHLNREYIVKRTAEIEDLRKEIAELDSVLKSKTKVRNIIIKELQEVSKLYSKPRKSSIIYSEDVPEVDITEEIPDYAVNLFFTQEGYFKKITPLSLRMGGEQKLKESDSITQQIETTNNTDLLFFTNKAQVYKSKASEFADTKASVLGEFVPAKLQMDEDESAVYMAVTKDYSGYLLFFYDNGKVAKIDLASYQTKTNRKKLINAYCDKFPLSAVLQINEDIDVVMTASSGKMLVFNTGLIAPKSAKASQGIQVMKLNKGHRVMSAKIFNPDDISNPSRYRRTIPAFGILPTGDEPDGQTSL